MENSYKLHQIREIAGGDESFIPVIIAAFLEEIPEAVQLISEGLEQNNHEQVYQNTHKIKPTLKQFELTVYDDLITLQDWGKFKQNTDVTPVFEHFLSEISTVIVEMKTDFNL